MVIIDIREFTPDSWRNHIGLVPQDPILFTGTISENIAYGMPNAARAEIEDAAKAANCDFIWEMPYGFDTRSTVPMHSLRRYADRGGQSVVIALVVGKGSELRLREHY
jgi:ABC-type transport system involved in Fe-S cluster assembly fused permease/ATPase subunit